MGNPVSRSTDPTDASFSWILYFSLNWKDSDDVSDFFALSSEQTTMVRLKTDLVLALRKRMRKEGLTHENAAEKAGISRSSMTAIVGGNLTSVSLDRLMEACLRLGVTIKFQAHS